MEIELYQGEHIFTAELAVDPDTGEVMGGECLEMLVKRNPIGAIAYVLSAEKNKEMINVRIKELQKAAKTLENSAERAKESLRYVMQQTGTSRLESVDKTFSAVLYKDRDKSVDIFDEKQLPSDYWREIPAKFEPDKALIKQAIQDKFEVPGARILAKDRLELR